MIMCGLILQSNALSGKHLTDHRPTNAPRSATDLRLTHSRLQRYLLTFHFCRNAVAKLKAAGHTVVDWTSSLHTECIDIMDKYYTADGGQDIRDSIAEAGEPMIP